MDARTQVQARLGGQALIGPVKVPVHGIGRFHGIGRTIEFGKQSVTQALDQPTAAGRQDLVLRVLQEAVPGRHHERLVGGHEPDGLDQVHDQNDLVVLDWYRRFQLQGVIPPVNRRSVAWG